jgi:predicted DsbA family dithiol-disulfide isomerase
MAALQLTHYVDVLSSWGFVAESALATLRKQHGDRLAYEWRIAFLFNGGRMGYSPALAAWQYRRLEAVSGLKLNPAWRESSDDTTWWANLATEAARGLGVLDDRVRLAMSRAAMVDGEHVGRREVAVSVAVRASGLAKVELEEEMERPRTLERMWTSTNELRGMRLDVQPVFVLRNSIGDAAVLSGLFRPETFMSCASEMLAAVDGYAAYGAANAEPLEVPR